MTVRTFGGLDLPHFMGAAAAFAAARETGLLAALLAGAATPEEHAAFLGLDPRFTTRILDVLAALGLAHREEDRYGASYLHEWDRLLPDGVVNHAEFWSHAARCLRTGEPFLRMDGEPHDRELSYRGVVARLGMMLESAAAELAGKLPGSPERVLDVGAGSGVWSLAMAERHDETCVVALDLPAVLEAFRHRAVALGLDNRAETLPGDFHKMEIPPACFDRVIVANVLHLEPPSRAQVLISHLAPTLRSGGDLIVVDSFGGGTPERELAHAIYALNLALRTTGGKAHERPVVESWMEEASLAPAGFIELESWPGALAAIRANRPGANPVEASVTMLGSRPTTKS